MNKHNISIMEEVRVYHSLWKNLLFIASSFAFTAGFFLMDFENKQLIKWLGILFFGGGGLFMVYLILKERITGTPCIVITDNGVSVSSGKSFEVRFEDVNAFFIIDISKTKQIGIRYKKGVREKKRDNAKQFERLIRKANEKIARAQESIPASGLTIKPQTLCDLMNERLKAFQRHHQINEQSPSAAQ